MHPGAVLEELTLLDHRTPGAHTLLGPQQRALPTTALAPAGKASLHLRPAPQHPQHLNRVLVLVRLGQLHGIQLASDLDPSNPVGRHRRKRPPQAAVAHLARARSLRIRRVELLKRQLLLHGSTHLRVLGWLLVLYPGAAKTTSVVWQWTNGPSDRRCADHALQWPAARRGQRATRKAPYPTEPTGRRSGGPVAGGSASSHAALLGPCADLDACQSWITQLKLLRPIGVVVGPWCR